MTSPTPRSSANQHHEFEFPLTDGELDLDQISTQDLTRLVSIFLRVLADRHTADRQ
ncbi:MAG: hypothetical protein HLX51_02780 [Micrococcaceae bacterium]|nr:hypothetical protein [Micrococcaceae bacterium]